MAHSSQAASQHLLLAASNHDPIALTRLSTEQSITNRAADQIDLHAASSSEQLCDRNGTLNRRESSSRIAMSL